jgi:toxin HigB-1
VIASFGDEATEAVFHGERGKKARSLPPEIYSTAVRKLDMLNAAADLRDLRAPPGNRLEALRGDLKGKHSIRVNDQWRIVFRWESGDAHDVEIVDYH